MREPEYWEHLEFRICSEINAMYDPRLRGFWCDGLVPEAYAMDAHPPCITGRAWIGHGPRCQEQWRFTLLLPGRIGGQSSINWARLLPDENATGWLSLYPVEKRLELDPAKANSQPS